MSTLRLVPPFTRQQINEMHAKDFDFVSKKYPEAVQRALNPPPVPVPAPPLFPRSDITKIAVAEEMASEYLAFAKSHILGDGTIPEFVWDAFLKSKNEAAQLKNAEAEVEKWLKNNPEFVPSEANRTAIRDRLQELDLPVTYSNLDQVFAALVASGDVTVKPPDFDWQSGAWRNGVWVPDGTGAAQRRNVDPSRAASEEKKVTKRVSQMSAKEFLSNLIDSPSFKQKVDGSVA
jgi:hypothetical protein